MKKIRNPRQRQLMLQQRSKIPSFTMVRLLFAFLILWSGPSALGALAPSEVMVLVNRDSKISLEIAQMYQKLRGIPAGNILRFSLGTSREISLEQYRLLLAAPLKKYLEANPEIRCILTTSGVPYTLAVPGEEGAALDNELATVLRDPAKVRRRQPNPLFILGANSYGITDPRKLKMVYVARLDGPDLKLVTRMVEDALATEKTGLQGPVFGDARGIDGATGYGGADASLRGAIDRLSGAGFETKLDLTEETWTQPSGSVGNQAAGAAFYVGWYKLRDFQNIFGQQGLARGAIAWHIASGEAVNIWDASEKGWCVNLLRRGAAVTLGPVREPYVDAFPRGEIFVEALLKGATLAESYWLALPNVSWNMVILGDPLYRPFAFKPKPSLLAGAYISANTNHILEAKETSALLIQLECVGPTGSATAALSATAEAGMGLATASGNVTVPPLRAGQSTLIRVPRVTAGNDPTGIFRLHLNVQSDGEKSRRIVLEGRIGFSRLTGGLLPQSQMFVSPNGEFLITGQPGNSALINTESLRSQPIVLRKGVGLIGAEFSPDGAHIALTFLDPQQKKEAFVISDSKLANPQPLLAGFMFLRWLGDRKILLKGPDGLVSHDLGGGKDETFDTPAGWSGTVIPGTQTQMLVTKEGKLAFKNGSEPLHEVLQGVKAIRASAVANDLSMFSGVDSEKRLWVQHGVDRSPEVIDSGVEEVLWGPISRRVMVKEANGKARIYDGRDRSWTDLGVVFGAQWSPDEQRLLFVELEGKDAPSSHRFLSLLTGRRIRKLCEFDRIGELRKAVLSEDGERAFLLAGLAGGIEVWMMSLTPQAPLEIKPAVPEYPPKRVIIVH